jgi:hypothetical protein
MALGYRITADEHARLSDGEKQHYKNAGNGEFTLETTGDSPRVKEFRDNNVGLNTKVAVLEKELGDYRKLGSANAIATKLGAAPSPDPQVVQQLTTERDEAKKLADDRLKLANDRALKFGVTDVAVKMGVDPAMIDFVTFKATQAGFTVNDAGEVIPSDATKPSLSEWMEALQSTSPGAFKPSSGGGATGNKNNRETVKTISADQIGDHLEDVAAGRVKVGV